MPLPLFDKILNSFWVIIAAAGAVAATPGLVLSLYYGDYVAVLACAFLLPPFYYLLLSVYFEHLLEKRFDLRDEDVSYLLRFSPIWGLNFNRYCVSRRTLLSAKVAQSGQRVGAAGVRRTLRLIALHRVLMWAFYADAAVFVIVLLVALVTGHQF